MSQVKDGRVALVSGVSSGPERMAQGPKLVRVDPIAMNEELEPGMTVWLAR